MNYFKKLLFLIIISGVIGCTSSTYVRQQVELPSYIKKIAIAGFKVDPQHELMQEKLIYEVKDKFVQDGRMAMSNQAEADAVLFGEMTRYLVEAIDHDENFVASKYRLWVWLDISLIDNTTKELMWTEKRLEAKVEYGTNSEDSFAPSTEVEAQDIVVNDIADLIVKRTIDGWFAASGVSEKL